MSRWGWVWVSGGRCRERCLESRTMEVLCSGEWDGGKVWAAVEWRTASVEWKGLRPSQADTRPGCIHTERSVTQIADSFLPCGMPDVKAARGAECSSAREPVALARAPTSARARLPDHPAHLTLHPPPPPELRPVMLLKRAVVGYKHATPRSVTSPSPPTPAPHAGQTASTSTCWRSQGLPRRHESARRGCVLGTTRHE